MKTLLAAAAIACLALAAGPAAADGMPPRPAPKKARVWRAPPPPLPPAPEPIIYEEPLPPPHVHHRPMEVSLGPDFFAGGETSVGGFPSYASYGGGGYVVVGAGASAHAFASARANVSVSVRGGFRGGKGGKGGGGCCHGGGGKGKH